MHTDWTTLGIFKVNTFVVFFSMANEYLYFKKALDLHSKYNVTALLGDEVSPGQKYDPSAVVSTLSRALRLQDGLSVSPAVNCAHDNHFKDRLFYEIIICFDKEFNRIGCEDTKGGIYGSCGDENPFFYPDTIHPNCKHIKHIILCRDSLTI